MSSCNQYRIWKICLSLGRINLETPSWWFRTWFYIQIDAVERLYLRISELWARLNWMRRKLNDYPSSCQYDSRRHQYVQVFHSIYPQKQKTCSRCLVILCVRVWEGKCWMFFDILRQRSVSVSVVSVMRKNYSVCSPEIDFYLLFFYNMPLHPLCLITDIL